jgi:putative ABC transport system ATP-binding protein
MILDLKDIYLNYGDKVIFERFNMSVDKGEIVCISGESGCGKTSILNAILGFVVVKSGNIVVDNIEMSPATIDKIRQRIAWLPQELALPSEWVSEMVQLPFLLKANRNSKYNKEKLLECFRIIGLDDDLLNKRVSEISGGQRQRIMIAISSLLDKPLIIADEPTSALDAASTDKVMNFFRLQAQNGKAILLVSHDKQVASFADKHIIL